MRTIILVGCLLASTLSSVASSSVVELKKVAIPATTVIPKNGNQEAYCNYNSSEVTSCVDAYTAASKSQNICQALDEYTACLGDIFSCNSAYATTWNSSLSAYRSVWDSSCTVIPGIKGVSEPGMVFGDPHYRLTNGTFQTCNDLGTNVLAVSKYFIVKVTSSKVGSSSPLLASKTESKIVSPSLVGTVATEVAVEMYHAGAPAGNFRWTLTDSPIPTSKGGISVTANGIDASSIGLNLKVTRNADHLHLGLITKKLTGGILLNGCDEPEALPSTVNITGPCAAVPKAFRGACLFDSTRMNDTWASSSSTTASSEEASLEESAAKENGAPSSSKLAAAAGVAIAAMLALVL